jgi:four helix bundle protein
MNNKEFVKILESRTLLFAIRIIRLSAKLPLHPESKVIKYQITKAGTSIGANYREANRARSKADFKNKIRICESETSETNYWIEVIRNMAWLKEEEMEWELKESEELLAIFSSITKKINLKPD